MIAYTFLIIPLIFYTSLATLSELALEADNF